MMRRFSFLALVLALAPAAAHADALPPASKRLQNSLVVTGKIPEGKALLLHNARTDSPVLEVGVPLLRLWRRSSRPSIARGRRGPRGRKAG